MSGVASELSRVTVSRLWPHRDCLLEDRRMEVLILEWMEHWLGLHREDWRWHHSNVRRVLPALLPLAGQRHGLSGRTLLHRLNS